jgi:hypothetical protein
MSTPPPSAPNRKQYWTNMSLAAISGGSGCLTLIIVLAALLGGLALDAHFQTRPVITLVLVFASIPISLIAMFLFTRTAVRRIKAQAKKTASDPQEGERLGESKDS